jgi:hypothetical protein
MNRTALIHLSLPVCAMTISFAKPAAVRAESREASVPVASDTKKNPFTLTYEGAIMTNEQGKVNIHPVTYKLAGLDISANVYTPPGYDPGRTYPAVAVAHPNGGVKEQVAGLYAQRLGLPGICGGGGYSLAAAQTDKRFRSIAALSMFNSGRRTRTRTRPSSTPRAVCWS